MADRRYSLILALLVSQYVTYSDLKHFHSIAGQFKVVIRRLEHCLDETAGKEKASLFFQDMRTMYTQEPTYSGNGTFPFYINNSIAGAMRIASWSNMGGWKENAHIIRTKSLCRNMNLVPSLWRSFSHSVYDEVVECNFYPGYIRFKNYTPSFRDVAVKHFFYGRWRADLRLEYSNGDVAGCIRGYGDTVPV